LNPRPPALRS